MQVNLKFNMGWEWEGVNYKISNWSKVEFCWVCQSRLHEWWSGFDKGKMEQNIPINVESIIFGVDEINSDTTPAVTSSVSVSMLRGKKG